MIAIVSIYTSERTFISGTLNDSIKECCERIIPALFPNNLVTSEEVIIIQSNGKSHSEYDAVIEIKLCASIPEKLDLNECAKKIHNATKKLIHANYDKHTRYYLFTISALGEAFGLFGNKTIDRAELPKQKTLKEATESADSILFGKKVSRGL